MDRRHDDVGTSRKQSTGERKRPSERGPVFRGWISTDEDEIRRREWRGRTEIDDVQPIDGRRGPFCDYRVRSSSGSGYVVEIRSLEERINSCGCRDFATNRLGTCKHVEGAVQHIGARGQRRSNDRIEVFLDERDREPCMAVPAGTARRRSALAAEVERLYGNLRRGSSRALRALQDMARSNEDRLRVSRRLEPWLEARQAAARKERARARFEADLASGRRSLDGLLRRPLLPYQAEGVLHLAFGERALLADDMGLGKTVQAIAACALLRELRGIERVLVVSPASLKAEWEEQIAKFLHAGGRSQGASSDDPGSEGSGSEGSGSEGSGSEGSSPEGSSPEGSGYPVIAVFGGPAARRAAYARRAFFTLCNYEQVLGDGPALIATLQPDVVILDEAQRIKNWQTKTANAVKKLHSRYAFVLTGTPLENRIDEVYSIVQFLDPELLGPLFRFNREFYHLDEKGRPVGYRNLEALADRVSSVMLRRRKDDVEGQLPGRVDKTFFVPMTDAQTSFYDDYERLAGRLASMARRRPLRKEEFEKLQRYLACMRMVCDTPYILDDKPYECPKMDELERLLPDLLDDPGCKIIVFSEWVRMLALVRDYALGAGLEFAWHTGSVPQQRRRAEIRRFREDPDCRLFLSSESGGVGLNLQAANVVVNMDQPWNPARLEQRIARAWRKHQTRPVTVIHLVSQDTIEHRMLGLLESKRALADGVLDRRGDLGRIRMPGGRAAFLEAAERGARRQAEGGGRRSSDRAVARREAARRLWRPSTARRCSGSSCARARERAGTPRLVVVSLPPDRLAEAQRRLDGTPGLKVTVIDQATHETMLRLAREGLISLPAGGSGGSGGEMREVYPPPGEEGARSDGRVLRATALVEQAKHKLKAAALLEGGGFPEEARAPAVEAALLATGAMAALRGEPEPGDADSAAAFLLREGLEEGRGDLPRGAVRVLSGDGGKEGAAGPVGSLLDWVSGALGVASDKGRIGQGRT